MKNTNTTYPKTLVIIRDCHWNHNSKVTVNSSVAERFIRNMAGLMGYQAAALRKEAAI